ncbi:tyrosine-tRNA ligase [Batrachochytrium salamandrivorans]|nr:tyrosine-tRNA ligase [Batrachochytrium salamandrivorans]
MRLPGNGQCPLQQPQRPWTLSTLYLRGICSKIPLTAVHCPDFLNRNQSLYMPALTQQPSLHVGNLISIIALFHFQRDGHKAIALIGGATGSIGDPSGKSSERIALDGSAILLNTDSIKAQLQSLFANAAMYSKKHPPVPPSSETVASSLLESTDLNRIQILNNAEWLQPMNLLEFITNIGRRVRISSMLARDSVRTRLNSATGISFMEFVYQLFQAYDFWYLFSRYGCQVQVGGSDQWGNITAGTDLIRRFLIDPGNEHVKHHIAQRAIRQQGEKPGIDTVDSEVAFGVTLPLITTSSGEKFGKSAGNAVWLNDSFTSVFDFYQFFRRTPDSEVEKYLSYFTFLSDNAIQDILARHHTMPENQYPQRKLAFHATELVHGENKASKACTMSEVLYDESLSKIPASQIIDAFKDDTRLKHLARSDIVGKTICDIAAISQATRSKSSARKLVSSGGLYLNKRRIESDTYLICEEDLLDSKLLLLRIGKSSYTIISLI